MVQKSRTACPRERRGPDRGEGAWRDGAVRKAQKKTATEKPPLLYDLTELQRNANARYGFTAERTLRAAQALYEERKLITYPRTSSR